VELTFHNLGAVRQATIDVRPLTVFVGPNNAGKTWTAYTIAACLGEHGLFWQLEDYEKTDDPHRYPPITECYDKLISEGGATVDIVEFFDRYVDLCFSDACNACETRLPEFLGAGAELVRGPVTVNVERSRAAMRDVLLGSTLSAGRFSTLLGARLRAVKHSGSGDVTFFTEGGIPDVPARAIWGFVATTILTWVRQSFCSMAYVLPTERAGLSSTSLNRPANPWSEEDSAPAAVDFIRTLATVIGPPARARPGSQRLVRLSGTLEGVLGGSIQVDEPTGQFTFTFPPGVVLHTTSASSMVRELAPMALYLQRVAEPGQLLVVDEPEMNLHPEAQAKLVELLCMLANAGIKVLITTHSPYLVDHLANLVKAAAAPDPRAIADLFFLRDQSAFIPADHVSVYEFADGSARSIIDELGEIDWGTFGRVSDRISEIYYAIPTE